VGSVQRVSDIIGEITVAAGEQSDGIGQVNVAVTQLDQMTQQNAALVEESAAAAESLKDQALRLDQVVRVFRTGDAGSEAPASVSRPAVPTAAVAAPAVAPAPKKTVTPPAVKAEPPTLSAAPMAPRAKTVPDVPVSPARSPAAASSSTHEGDWESF